MVAFHDAIGRAFNDGSRYRLHYVTARELANIISAAEAGERGDAGRFRDYRLAPPAVRATPANDESTVRVLRAI
jgi:hypothetical protein